MSEVGLIGTGTNLASHRYVVRVAGFLPPRTLHSLPVDVRVVNGHYGVGGRLLCRKTVKHAKYFTLSCLFTRKTIEWIERVTSEFEIPLKKPERHKEAHEKTF